LTIFPIAGRPPKPWGGGNLHIEHSLLESAAYKGLSNSAKCVLIELMRRYDGGNNGSISFGGPQGASAGFSDDVTERALKELQQVGFVVRTAPAVPYLQHPRKWRLTMYAVGRTPATKDFMRDPAPTKPEKSFYGVTGAGDSAQNASVMRATPPANLPASSTVVGEISCDTTELRDEAPILDTRAGDPFDAADTRTSDIHLEASPQALSRAGPPAFHALSPRGPHPVATSPVEAMEKMGATATQAIVEQSIGLFGDALPSAPTPLDRLRAELREVLIRKRGTQSRLAEALSLSRSAFSNALSGREQFTATAMGALRRWLDGEPISGGWPPLPPATENPNAA
jgi:hypothetical protein